MQLDEISASKSLIMFHRDDDKFPPLLNMLSRINAVSLLYCCNATGGQKSTKLFANNGLVGLFKSSDNWTSTKATTTSLHRGWYTHNMSTGRFDIGSLCCCFAVLGRKPLCQMGQTL